MNLISLSSVKNKVQAADVNTTFILPNGDKGCTDSVKNAIKSHLMNYGAIASGICWDFYDNSTNLVYNDGSLTRDQYLDSGHAITIIGWDDNYGTVNINGTNFTGSWLAMNSWGESVQYFYISYYKLLNHLIHQ